MTETQGGKKSLAAKLAEIVTETHHVAKRGRNEFHKYDYVTESDVLDAVRHGLASRRIMIVPRITGSTVVEKERQGKASEYITTVQMTFAILDGDSNEVLECPWIGCGQDSGDKGPYKALTGGYKYFLLKLFMIPTGDDPEKDEGNRESKRRRDAPLAPPMPNREATKAPANVNGGQYLTDLHRERLLESARTGRVPFSKVKQIIQENFGVDSSSRVLLSDFDKLLALIEGVNPVEAAK